MDTEEHEKIGDTPFEGFAVSDQNRRKHTSQVPAINKVTSVAAAARTLSLMSPQPACAKQEYQPPMANTKSDPQLSALSGDNITIPRSESTLAKTQMVGDTSSTIETLGNLRPTIHIIEDDPTLRQVARAFFQDAGYNVQSYYSAETFLGAPRPNGDACLVVDMMLPGISGVELLEQLQLEGCDIPAIMLTGRDDASTAVSAFKAGAVDFIEKPADQSVLIKSVSNAIGHARELRSRSQARSQERDQATACFAKLTPRESEVLLMVLDGSPSKNIAADLGISQRTVECHRASIMCKTRAASIPELMQLFISANSST